MDSEFISKYQTYQSSVLIGVQDWADKLSFTHSVIILIICNAIVTTKTYFLKPLACHVPTTPAGSNFKSYLESYCWVHGTTPLRMNETFPDTEEAWDAVEFDRKLNYYQWVPFILGLQTILFYLPHVAWQNITFNRLGTDLTSIISKSMNALSTVSPSEREKNIINVAERLEMLLFAHRDNRSGGCSNIKRKLGDMCGFLFVSKRMGTWTVFSYLCIKLLYLANAIGQLYLMKVFLGYGESMIGFGYNLAHSLITKSDWRETLYFPRVTFCSVNIRHLGQSNNRFIGMCALAVNMLNEKIYIFLWFWTVAVVIATSVSLVSWILRLVVKRHKSNIIRKYLQLKPVDSESSDSSLESDSNMEQFIKEFLRLDGVFIIYMLNLNAGDIITGEIVRLLWKTWQVKYANKHNFKNDPWKQYSYPFDEKTELIEKIE